MPIPKSGYENKVFYVWFDAPMAYIAMTQDWAEQMAHDQNAWQRWWLDEQDETCYVQFMAKDNLPFHSIMWPAMLLGTEQPWKTVDILKGFHWLTYESGKFSTSQNRGIFSDTALKLFPADYWRYYLLANIPESQDSDFKLQDFMNTVNKDLVGTLGNFVNRVAALVNKYFEGKVPPYESNNDYVKKLQTQCKPLLQAIHEDYTQLNFRALMRRIRELWVLGNEFITEAAPWSLVKQDQTAAANVLAACLHLIRIYSYISYPIIPAAAQKIFSYLALTDEQLARYPSSGLLNFACLPTGKPLAEVGLIFEKISDEQAQAVLQQFATEKA